MIDLKEIKNKIITKNNLYCLCVISIIFFLDRYIKLLILNNFTENTYYLNDYINLNLIWNTGIGFGLMSFDNQIFYNSISVIIGLVIFFKAVPDFIDIHYGNFHWFTFNIADIFITIGVICLITIGFFIKD